MTLSKLATEQVAKAKRYELKKKKKKLSDSKFKQNVNFWYRTQFGAFPLLEMFWSADQNKQLSNQSVNLVLSSQKRYFQFAL